MKFTLLILLIAFYRISSATAFEETNPDRIKRLHAKSTSVHEKAVLLNEISWAYYEDFNDSSLIYGQKALAFTQKHDEPAQRTLALLQLAEFSRAEGNYSLANDYLKQAYQKLKNGSFPELVATHSLFQGNLKFSTGNYETALFYYKKGLAQSQKHDKKLQAEFYIRFAKINLRENDLDAAEKNLLKAASVAKQSSNAKKEISAYNDLGNLFARKQAYDEAKLHFEKSLALSIEYGNLRGQSRAYLNIGNLYYFKGYWTTSGEYYVKSAAIKQKLKDFDGLAKIHNNIGAIYKEQGRYQKSIAYYQKSAAYYEKIGDTLLLAETWVNISVSKIFQKKQKEGEQLLLRTLKLLEDKNNVEAILSVRVNLAFAQYEMGHYEQTLDELNRARDIAETLRNPHTMAFIDNLYGASYYHLGNNTKALAYYQKSLEKAKELGLLNEQDKALFGLYETEKKLGHFKESIAWFEAYTALKDSLFNLESTARLNELQEKYDSGQKEFEITHLKTKNRTIQLENELKTNQLQSSRLVVGFVLLGILAIGVLSYQRVKRQKLRLVQTKKTNEAQIRQLILEQESKTMETIVETQQSERKRLAKDLHDTLGSYLATLKYQHESISPEDDSEKAQLNHQKIAGLIQDAHTELRSISHQMDTSQNVEFDLTTATSELVDRIRDTQQFSVHFHSFIEHNLSIHVELALYKIIQELFSNVLNHANATEVTLQINQHENDLVLVLEDNGKGFALKTEKKAGQGIGLSNIAERVNQIQGKLEINSQINAGTTVLIIVPINPNSPA